MHDIALVMPMAGRGSRFRRAGVPTPKPLVELYGRPFFWWATESLMRSIRVRELVFVVLSDHVERFEMDARIRAFYPSARIVTIADVTSGAAETAALGVAALHTTGPIAINDCDHAFLAREMQPLVGQLQGPIEGALLGFRAAAPMYSYVRFDDRGRVAGTVEKQTVSEFAIAGCYLFSSAPTFTERFAEYRRSCPYDELFISGLYNGILDAGGEVLFRQLDRHVPFGTPEECERVGREDLSFLDPA
jgi:dTDP-glucose pyrophosphorylase